MSSRNSVATRTSFPRGSGLLLVPAGTRKAAAEARAVGRERGPHPERWRDVFERLGRDPDELPEGQGSHGRQDPLGGGLPSGSSVQGAAVLTPW